MGIEQVELLPGSAAAKRRLEVLLANLAGELTVEQACAKLGLHKSRFFELRKQWLQESVQALEPEPSGRPVGTGHLDAGHLDAGQETPGMCLNPLPDPEIGSDAEKRPPRIAYNASGRSGPTPDTSRNGPVGTSQQQVAELLEQVGQLQWELRAAQLREELAALGLSRPKVAGRAQKKTGLPGGLPRGERGGAR
jgi:hypothetical protein